MTPHDELARLVAAVEEAKIVLPQIRLAVDHLIDARNALEAQAALRAGEPASEHDPELEPVNMHVRCERELADLRDRLAACEGERQDLSEDVAEYQALAALQRRRERPWIERWRQATGKHDTLPDYGEMLGWLVEQADAARLAQAQAERGRG